MEQERLSYCRICAAACGIVVTVDDQRVLRVRGDAGHPVSRGYTCAKGRGLPAWHHSASRLDRPQLRGRTVEWETVLDDLAGVVGSTIDAHGADAVGLYLATGLAYDAAGQVAAATWLPTIGSRSFFTAVTVDNAPVLVAAELVTGHAMLNPVWDPQAHGLLLLVGTNPVVSHGYGTAFPDPVRHLRDFRRGGGRVWVLDPRRTETAALADVHLAARPGSDVAVLAAVAAALLHDADPTELAAACDPDDLDALRAALAPFTVERAARAAALAPEAVDALVDTVRAHRGRLAVMCGTGVTMSRDGVVAEWLRWVLLVLSGSLDVPGGMRFNRGAVTRLRAPRGPRPPRPAEAGAPSRPDLPRVVGQVPALAMADEIEAGRLRVLVLAGGNPVTAFPEPERMRAALRALDALVVVDVAGGELCDLATHVLPATGQLERADLTLAEATAIRSGLQATAAVVDPVAGRRPVWWMFAQLGRRLGREPLGGADPDDLTDEDLLGGMLARGPLAAEAVLGAGPRGIDVPEEHGWVRGTMLPGGRWRIAPEAMLTRLRAHRDPVPPGATTELVLVPRRVPGWSNSVRYGGGEDPTVRAHPLDAGSRGLGDGDRVRVSGAHGTVVAVLVVDETLAPGVVSMTHGVADRSPGALVSSRVDADPVTAMPRASGLLVTMAAAD